VPDFASDVAKAMIAERSLPADRIDAYSMALRVEVAHETGEGSPAAYARASALARSRAMLRAVGVDPDTAVVVPSVTV
jgi:hypothetical protein